MAGLRNPEPTTSSNASVMRFMALLTSGLILPVSGYGLIIIVLAQRQYATSFEIGLILAAGGIGSIVGAVVVGPLRRRFSFGKMMIGATWLWALTWLFFAIAPNPLMLGIATALSFIVVPIYMISEKAADVILADDSNTRDQF